MPSGWAGTVKSISEQPIDTLGNPADADYVASDQPTLGGCGVADGADGVWALGPRQRSAVISWAAFALTFAGTRAVTYAIKNDVVGTRNLKSHGVHLHHYLWGIKLLAASGGVAIHGGDRVRANPLVAVGYGAGAALVVDEFALLVHLKDVYWKKRGRVSVLLGTGLIGAVGASFLAIPTWRRCHNPPTQAALAESESPTRLTTNRW